MLFAETNPDFCYYLHLILLEPIRIFATTVFDFCWNQPRNFATTFSLILLEPARNFATTVFDVCWNQLFFLLPQSSTFARTNIFVFLPRLFGCEQHYRRHRRHLMLQPGVGRLWQGMASWSALRSHHICNRNARKKLQRGLQFFVLFCNLMMTSVDGERWGRGPRRPVRPPSMRSTNGHCMGKGEWAGMFFCFCVF